MPTIYPTDIFIIPLVSGEKRPAVSGWTTSSNYNKHTRQVKETQPPAYGVITGEANGLIVIDYDIKTPEAKEAFTLENLKAKHGDDCYIVQTGSGGFHAYHEWEDRFQDWGNSVGKIDGCVDIRSNNGQAVGAGSVIQGKEYRAMNGDISALTRMPDRLFGVYDEKLPRKRQVEYTGTEFTDEVLRGLERLGFTGVEPVLGASSNYNFRCDQMGKRGPPCPLCDNRHTSNNFRIQRADDGSVWVRNHSDKCRITKATNADFLIQLDGVEAKPPPTEYDRLKGEFAMVAKISSKPFYVVENPDDILDYHTFPQLRERFSDWNCENPKTGKEMNFVDIWSRDPDKRQYRKLDFLPNQGHTDDTYNTWRGFEVCKLGEVEPSTDISPFHRLVEALTDGETDYFVKWLADIFQNPDRKNGVMVFITGQQGIGKGSLKNLLRILIGKEMTHSTSNPDRDLFGRFATATKNKMLCVLEEAEGSKIKPNASCLKDLIDNETTQYEEKGVMAIEVKSFVRFLAFSNNETPLIVEESDRRTTAFKARPDLKHDPDFFPMWNEWVKDKANQRGVYDYLMGIDLSQMDWIRDRPATKLYRDMKEACLPMEKKWLAHLIVEAFPQRWERTRAVRHTDLYESFRLFCAENATNFRTSSIGLGKRLNKLIEEEQLPIASTRNGHTGRNWTLDRTAIFGWLKANGYTREEMIQEALTDEIAYGNPQY